MVCRSRQRAHIRKYKSGKKRVVNPGVRKRRRMTMMKVPPAVKRQYLDSIAQELKSKGRVALPGVGVLRVKSVRAKKGGKKVQAFGKTYITKAKPATKKVKFRPSKSLKEMF